MDVELDTVRVLVLSVAVLWTGDRVTLLLPVLARFSIPVAVTGLSAKLGTLKDGGKAIAILGALTLVFLVAQNAIGISLALLREAP